MHARIGRPNSSVCTRAAAGCCFREEHSCGGGASFCHVLCLRPFTLFGGSDTRRRGQRLPPLPLHPCPRDRCYYCTTCELRLSFFSSVPLSLSLLPCHDQFVQHLSTRLLLPPPCIHSTLSSICKQVRTRYRNPPHKRVLVGYSSPYMRLAQHLTACRAWCKKCLPGR